MQSPLELVEIELNAVRENNIAISLLYAQNIERSKVALRVLTSPDVTLHWDLEYEYDDSGGYYANIDDIQLAFTPAGTDYRVEMVFANESTLDDAEPATCTITDALGNDADENTAEAICNAHALNTDTMQYKVLCNTIRTAIYSCRSESTYATSLWP